ncbi:MAG: epoxyqueuosine reductase [Acholeplasmataceae bacterium]|nr:epoxyqueuosine reductase [Acholeplasmataceae bacterium]
MMEKYLYGIIPFSEYQKYRKVKKKDWIKSILVFLFPYPNETAESSGYKVAKYAYGQDYHQVIATKLEEIAQELHLERYQVLVDQSFLDEKFCASLAGLGKVGRNNLLLTPEYGSRVLIGEIVTSEELHKKVRLIDNPCIDCKKCIEACPSGALDDGFNKQRCLSYLSQSNSAAYDLYDRMVLAVGCDICQDVCPVNGKTYDYQVDFEFDAKAVFKPKEFYKLSEEEFQEYYRDKTFNYLGYLKILRNILVLEVKNKDISREELENFQKLYPEKWFVEHLEYLKGRL